MSVQALLQAALVAALEARLDGVAVFDAPPARAGGPYAVVEESVLADWSTKDSAGRQGRIAVTLHDRGERPVRLGGAAEDAIVDMPGDIGGGWRLIGSVLARSRIARGESDRWWAMSEFQVRMLRTQ
jgi:hypothetical protein